MNDGNAELTRWRHAAPAWPVQGTCPNVFLDDTIVPAEKRSVICHRPICGIPSSSRVYPSGLNRRLIYIFVYRAMAKLYRPYATIPRPAAIRSAAP